MKGTTLSNCERNFILNAASKFKRLDGRKLDDFRNLEMHFGNDYGLCYASLGETRVIAQVTCDVQQPKTTRPNEGLLFINVEVSSMAAPYIEPNRSSDINNQLNRLLEKCIKDSRAVDLESLCLIAEEKVWALRVDVNVLNHDGNLVQAASIAAVAALAHFKRPDVTTDGNEIIITNINERDPIPLTLHHYPVYINYALVNNGENVLADPTSAEERISDASLIFAINAYGEICGLHLGGNALVEPSLILKYSKRAAIKAKEIVDVIKEALNKDGEARQYKTHCGLVESIVWDEIKSMSSGCLKIQLNKFGQRNSDKKMMMNDGNGMELSTDPISQVVDLGNNCAELIPKHDENLCNAKFDDDDDDANADKVMKEEKKVQIINDNLCMEIGEGRILKWDEKSPEDDLMEDSQVNSEIQIVPQNSIQKTELSGDSEEEVMVLESNDIENPSLSSLSSHPSKAITNTAIGKCKNGESKSHMKKNRRRNKRP